MSLTAYSLSLYQSVLSNTGDAAELLTEGLKGEGVPENILEDSLKCIQVTYMPRFDIWVFPCLLVVTGMGVVLHTGLRPGR